MQLFKNTNIKFLKYKYIALAITGIIISAGIVNVTAMKGLKLGVDFGEGTLLRIMFKTPLSVGQIRQELRQVGLGDSMIQEIGREGREFQIRTMQVAGIGASDQEQMEAHEALANQVIEALSTREGDVGAKSGLVDLNTVDERSLAASLESEFPGSGPGAAEAIIDYRNERGIITDFGELSSAGIRQEIVDYLSQNTYLGQLTILSRETVGPQVGKDLRRKAVQATVWSLIGMLAYIAIRFKFEYGIAAIFTLTQDVLITMSIFSFTNREINLPIIAAVLTIVGYSINDTIVIFDRVRENIKLMRRQPLEEIMNTSLNQTLSRTLITAGTVFLTVLALFLFGGEVINDFAFVMLVGTIEGTYSTIYLSCPVVLFWQRYFKPKKTGRR